jgi:hypothetical protein
MLIQPRPLVPFTFERRIFKPYLLRVEFSTDDAAPLTSPYIGEVGQLTINDSTSVWAASGGFAVPQANNSLAEQPAAYDATGLARVVGRAFVARLKQDTSLGGTTSANFFNVGFLSSSAPTGTTQNVLTGILFRVTSTNSTICDNGSAIYVPAASIPVNTYARVVVVARSTGAFLFLDGALVWVAVNGSFATLYAAITERTGVGSNFAPPNIDYVRVRDVGSPFDSDYGIAAVHTSAASGSDYAAAANGIFDLVISAPAALAGEAGLKFRKNGGDYWKVNFDSSGSLIVQRYASNVAQGSPVTLATSAISPSATRTIRVITNGANMDFYTLSGTSWTKRGSTQTDSHLSANTGISPFADAAWTTGGGALGQIDAYARTASQYDLLDSI